VAIKLTNLENIANEYKTQNFVYSDIHLDIITEQDYYVEAADYNLNAIKNSLNNLFNTKPGERFLFPNYGLDLSQFLFEPVTDYNGRLIGEKIVRSIELFETRVVLKQCEVNLLPEENQYDINLTLEFPIFSTRAVINTILDMKSQAFMFVESNNKR
jgi:phage baseplate assembly protein W